MAHLAFSPDGQAIAASRGDLGVTLWDVNSGRITARYADYEEPVTFLAFGPDQTTLLAREGDRVLSIRSASRPERRNLWDAKARSIESAAVSPDGKHLALGGSGSPVVVWELTKEEARRQHRNETSTVVGLAFLPHNGGLVIGSEDGTVRLWRPESAPDPRTQLSGHDGEAWSVAFSPDGRRLASGGDDEAVRLWDVATSQLLVTFRGHHSTVTSVAFSPDGRTLASGSLDRTVRLWKIETDSNPHGRSHDVADVPTLSSDEPIRCLSFSIDGRSIAAGGRNGLVRLWDVATLASKTILRDPGKTIHVAEFSPNGHWLATGGNDHSLRLWDSGGSTTIRNIDGESELRAVAFSPDGQTLAAAWNDRSLSLHRIFDREKLLTLPRHAMLVRTLAFSPDGQTLATGC